MSLPGSSRRGEDRERGVSYPDPAMFWSPVVTQKYKVDQNAPFRTEKNSKIFSPEGPCENVSSGPTVALYEPGVYLHIVDFMRSKSWQRTSRPCEINEIEIIRSCDTELRKSGEGNGSRMCTYRVKIRVRDRVNNNNSGAEQRREQEVLGLKKQSIRPLVTYMYTICWAIEDVHDTIVCSMFWRAWCVRLCIQEYDTVPCTVSCDQYTWQTGDWSVCTILTSAATSSDAHCGPGLQSRSVRYRSATPKLHSLLLVVSEWVSE